MRWIVWLPLLALSLSLSWAQEAPQTITWWYARSASPEDLAAFERHFIAPFNASQERYRLEVDFSAGEFEGRLRAALLAGQGPDIVMTSGPSYMLPLVEAGLLVPLDDFADALGWRERFLPVMLELNSVDGVLYGVPRNYETLVLFYNRSLFEARGWSPPRNLAELEALAEAMLAEGIIPFAAGNADWRGANEWYVTVVLNHLAGPERVAQALRGELPWTAPEFVAAIELLQRWFEQGWFGDDYFSIALDETFSLLASGQAGMSLNGTWAFQWIEPYFGATGQTADWVPIPPLAEGVPAPLYVLGIGNTLSISRDSQHPEGAALVLDYLLNPDFIANINRDWPGDWVVPAQTLELAALADELPESYARHLTDFAESVAAGRYGYTTWSFWPPRTNQYIISGIEQVWFGQLSPEAFLSELDALFQEELQAGLVPSLPDAR